MLPCPLSFGYSEPSTGRGSTREQGTPAPLSMLLTRARNLRFGDFLTCDFTGTLEQLAGKIQSSAPPGLLTRASVLSVPCV